MSALPCYKKRELKRERDKKSIIKNMNDKKEGKEKKRSIGKKEERRSILIFMTFATTKAYGLCTLHVCMT